jgi:hypothetical protein
MSNTFLSPSFDDEPEVETEEPVDDSELTDDNTPHDSKR